MTRRRYTKRPSEFVLAVQLDLETDGFTCAIAEASRPAKRGNWLVNNNGDTYTVNGETFARTYRATGPGTSVKTTPVWAEEAKEAGDVPTQEGSTH